MIFFGGRRSEQSLIHGTLASRLDLLIAIGSSNPFEFSLLKDENDLADHSEKNKNSELTWAPVDEYSWKVR
ncbi:hypothetical protein PRIPAC_82386 [Pristionchus pacificus]|uniref:Uncharacterized protein n=1 Tax=Pristionchus pacificus TaxID=54126 RepID=A0A2A6CN82_PRIPA|nr:hypothetical protein PRIPAC_82386 [Pristionchus pacificus]|eukprot:PDM79695.1 hypothetical protein PRIPAC_32274 [Pristionchus pacificus]